LCILSISSAPEPINTYFGTSDATLDLLLNWGPIVFIPVVPFASWLLGKPRGLSIAMRIGAVLCVLACGVRAIPCLLGESVRTDPRSWGLLHVGQILNAGTRPP
jgi:hypothetical protein